MGLMSKDFDKRKAFSQFCRFLFTAFAGFRMGILGIQNFPSIRYGRSAINAKTISINTALIFPNVQSILEKCPGHVFVVHKIAF